MNSGLLVTKIISGYLMLTCWFVFKKKKLFHFLFHVFVQNSEVILCGNSKYVEYAEVWMRFDRCDNGFLWIMYKMFLFYTKLSYDHRICGIKYMIHISYFYYTFMMLFLYFWSFIAPVPIHFQYIKNRQWTFSKKILCSVKYHNLMTAEDMGKCTWLLQTTFILLQCIFVTSEAQHF